MKTARHPALLLPFLLLVLTIAACEGGGGSTGGSSGETTSGTLSPPAPGQEEAFCDALRSRAACSSGGSATE